MLLSLNLHVFDMYILHSVYSVIALSVSSGCAVLIVLWQTCYRELISCAVVVKSAFNETLRENSIVISCFGLYQCRLLCALHCLF